MTAPRMSNGPRTGLGEKRDELGGRAGGRAAVRPLESLTGGTQCWGLIIAAKGGDGFQAAAAARPRPLRPPLGPTGQSCGRPVKTRRLADGVSLAVSVRRPRPRRAASLLQNKPARGADLCPLALPTAAFASPSQPACGSPGWRASQRRARREPHRPPTNRIGTASCAAPAGFISPPSPNSLTGQRGLTTLRPPPRRFCEWPCAALHPRTHAANQGLGPRRAQKYPCHGASSRRSGHAHTLRRLLSSGAVAGRQVASRQSPNPQRPGAIRIT